MKAKSCEVGDTVNGWKINEIYSIEKYGQQRSMAKIESVIGKHRFREVKLTLLTNNQIGWADNRRYSENNSQKTHGLTKHSLYNRYKAMVNRCYNEKNNSYVNYGGRGICVCDEWYNNFLNYFNWCMDNKWEDGLVVDRINNDGNYCPENCRLVTPYENNKNKPSVIQITAFGETKTANEWALDSRCKTSYPSLVYRIKHQWESEEAILLPNKQRKFDNFKQYKSFYDFCKKEHPDIVKRFINGKFSGKANENVVEPA